MIVIPFYNSHWALVNKSGDEFDHGEEMVCSETTHEYVSTLAALLK